MENNTKAMCKDSFFYLRIVEHVVSVNGIKVATYSFVGHRWIEYSLALCYIPVPLANTEHIRAGLGHLRNKFNVN